MRRRHYYDPELLSKGTTSYTPDSARFPVREGVGNLVSSETEEWEPGDMPLDHLHLPALDIDHAVRVVPSETPGHHHLFIDVPMTWTQYEKLLRVLGDVGILEEGYVSASIVRRATYLATEPWKTAA